jgi:hypothetical protein
MLFPLNALPDFSPNAHRTASTMLDLPHPLGPTIAVMPLSRVMMVSSAKDLNPTKRIFFYLHGRKLRILF